MKYCIAFHFVNGREVRMTKEFPDNVDIQARYDELANMVAAGDFFHFVENGQLVLVNMANVAYVRVHKIEEDAE